MSRRPASSAGTLPAGVLPVSVIVVSRGRPAHLRLCLTALSYQDHPAFEIILVADPAGLGQRDDLAIKRIGFDIPNISAARNLGLAQAAGAVVAFIDDDSVAEPGWLSQLCAPFADPAVVAATGWTRDRDGFRWQSRTQRITPDGLPQELPAEARTLRLTTDAIGPVSTLGTNCAFRADTLRAIGGFDPGFAHHLDESDVNMRMAAACPAGLTAVVPAAQVIHARAGSPRRDTAAVPLDMQAQGLAAAIFARRHGGDAQGAALLARTRRHLIRHMMEGRLDPLRVAPVLDSLRAGLQAGQIQPLPVAPAPRRGDDATFCRIIATSRAHIVFGGWHWQRARLRARAARALAEGQIATVILFSPSFLPHRLRLAGGGWFEQTGGLWGASEADDPPARWWRLRDRLARETALANRRRNRLLA